MLELTSYFTLVAEQVIRDESKKASFINLFDRIYASQLPTVQTKLVIIFGVKTKKGKETKKSLHVYIYKPDGSKLAEAQIPEQFDAPSGEGQIIADVSGMPIEAYGNYKFVLGYSENDVISTKVVEVLPPQEGSDDA